MDLEWSGQKPSAETLTGISFIRSGAPTKQARGNPMAGETAKLSDYIEVLHHQFQNFGLRIHVQPARWLVEQKQIGGVVRASGRNNFLLIAAAEAIEKRESQAAFSLLSDGCFFSSFAGFTRVSKNLALKVT